MKEEKVILVDTNDEPVGLMNKMAAHEQGILHRAFSVFILNAKNELMLQKLLSGENIEEQQAPSPAPLSFTPVL